MTIGPRLLRNATGFGPAAEQWAQSVGIMNGNGDLLVQNYSSVLTTYAGGQNPSSFFLSLVTSADAPTLLNTLGGAVALPPSTPGTPELFALWTYLNADTSLADGDYATVSAFDTGTHHDPVTDPDSSGVAVNNEGLYQRVNTGPHTGFRRIGDSDNQITKGWAQSIAGLLSSVSPVGGASWAWTDNYRRISMKIRNSGEVWANKFQTNIASIGSLTIIGSESEAGKTTSVTSIGDYIELETDRFHRRRYWVGQNGETGISKLVRPGGANVYDQIDALEAEVFGSASASVVAQLRLALPNGYFPDTKRTDLPTLTVGANNGTTMMTSPILVAMSDSRFSYSGGVMALGGVAFPNNDSYVTVSKMVGYTDGTNTTPVYDGNGFDVEFYHTGSEFEIVCRCGAGATPTLPNWLTVDQQMVPTTFLAHTPGLNQPYHTLVQFGSSKKRLIRIAVGDKFAGINVASSGEIGAVTIHRPQLGLLGDSWTSGTGTLTSVMAWPFIMARALGIKIKNCGVGSTGIVQEKQATWAGSGQPLVNYVDPYRLAQFCAPDSVFGMVCGSQNDANVSPTTWGPYGTSLDDAYNSNLHKIVDAWIAAAEDRPLIFMSGTSPNSTSQLYQYFKNRDTMEQVACNRRKDNVFFFDNNQPLTPWPGTGTWANMVADGNSDLSSLYVGDTNGLGTAHPGPAGHMNRGLFNMRHVKNIILTEMTA